MKHASNVWGRRTIALWPDAGRALGLGKNATYEGAVRGEIPGAFRIGKHWLVSVVALEKFLETAGQKAASGDGEQNL